MIAQLRGRVVGLHDDQAIVDCGGVGYQVYCHLRTLARLHDQREAQVTLYVHTGVSADAIRLYGFLADAELRLFRLLIGVERIGPKAALGIVGRAELPAMVRAITDGDAALVATVPGIGRKTAERVILELRDKVGSLLAVASASELTADQLAADAAVSGLVGLGFREGAARAAVSAAAAETQEADVAGIVGAALRRLDAVGANP